MREPLLKIMHFIRAMEYTSVDSREIMLREMQKKIGQESFSAPSVFSFFLPEYVPPGPIGDALLFSPETEILTTPHLISYVNGMLSFINYGLTHCHHGFGDTVIRDQAGYGELKKKNYCGKLNAHIGADGSFQFKSLSGGALATVEEMDTLITQGRLSDHNFQVILDAYRESANSDEAMDLALKFLEQTEYLGKMLDNAQLDTTNWADDTISLQMNQVAKIMKMRSELGNERDVFMLKLGGWDTHSDLKEDFNEQLTKINDALSNYLR
eukprot:g1671.t1